MNCPLCGSLVTYFGMTNIECSGPGCQNYKEQPLPDFKLDFDDTLIDWSWFVGFCAWLGGKTVKKLVPVLDRTPGLLDLFVCFDKGAEYNLFGVHASDSRKLLISGLIEHHPVLAPILAPHMP